MVRRATGVALVFFWFTAASLDAQGPSADELAVRGLLNRMIDAFNSGNFAGVAATFTANGTMIAGDGSQHTGRSAIERFFVKMRTSLPTYTRFQAIVTSVQFINANVAVVLYEGGFMIPGETSVAPERFGLQSLIAVREGGRWSAGLVQRTRIPPPRPPDRPAQRTVRPIEQADCGAVRRTSLLETWPQPLHAVMCSPPHTNSLS